MSLGKSAQEAAWHWKFSASAGREAREALLTFIFEQGGCTGQLRIRGWVNVKTMRAAGFKFSVRVEEPEATSPGGAARRRAAAL